MPDSPTQSTYDSLTQAYDCFNAALFAGNLPPCLLTMQRRRGAYGFFCGGRFTISNDPGLLTDEIALNPAHFATRSAPEILATLVHEMTHLWQHHQGKPSRAGYHNRQWAQKMQEIGLVPLPDGNATGQHVEYTIAAGGAFAHACEAFLARQAAVLYQDRPSGADKPAYASRIKTRYLCPGCGVKVWAKAGVLLECGVCRQTLQAAAKTASAGAAGSLL